MEFKSPLRQRIINSFVLLTTVVSGLFGLGITLTVHYVEERLVSDELQWELNQALNTLGTQHSARLDEATQFFVGGSDLPEYLHSIPPGFTEVVLDNRAYYAFHKVDGTASYYLIRDQTDFEKRETYLVAFVLAGFILSVLVAFLLGRFLANKVIAPVSRLTHQVRDRDKLLAGAPPLSPDYADDEVGTLAKAFDATLLMLQQALQREAMFTSDVSHELRTPLMVINSSCDMLIAKNGLDDYALQRVAMIRKATGEIQELVEAFLALARGRDTRLDTASLPAIVQAGLANWRQQAAEKGLSFTVVEAQGEEGAAAAGTYPVILMRTVLNNLINNAIHHTVQGGLSLRILPNGFELSDSGSGIDAAEKTQVFKPFYRGALHHRNSLGLGLSLVQRICEREHWTISLADNEPRGCRFTVALV